MIATAQQSALLDTIASAAESYLGTPFRHQGRRPRVGLDCAGVVVCAHRAAGVELCDDLRYRPLPAESFLDALMLRNFHHALDLPARGRVLRFSIGERNSLKVHLGLALSVKTFVHVERGSRVSIAALYGPWFQRLIDVWGVA